MDKAGIKIVAVGVAVIDFLLYADEVGALFVSKIHLKTQTT